MYLAKQTWFVCLGVSLYTLCDLEETTKCGVLASIFNRQYQHISDLNIDLENKLRKLTVNALAKFLY